MNLKLYVAFFLVILAVIFVFQNFEVVEISFLFWTARMSRALLILLILVIGIVIGWSMCGYAGYRRRRPGQ